MHSLSEVSGLKPAGQEFWHLSVIVEENIVSAEHFVTHLFIKGSV